MMTVKSLLLLLAAISFFLAAVEAKVPRIDLTALGLFLAAVSFLLG